MQAWTTAALARKGYHCAAHVYRASPRAVVSQLYYSERIELRHHNRIQLSRVFNAFSSALASSRARSGQNLRVAEGLTYIVIDFGRRRCAQNAETPLRQSLRVLCSF